MVLRMLGRPSSLRPFIGRDQILFFEPDRGTNPGGGPAPVPAPALPPGSTPANDRQDLQGLLARHNNDAMQVVATLLAENHQLRDERRQLRGQVPAQGAVVLAGDDVQRWQQYQQLGAIDALQQQLQGAQTTQAELAARALRAGELEERGSRRRRTHERDRSGQRREFRGRRSHRAEAHRRPRSDRSYR